LGTSETSTAPSPNCPPESCSNRKRDGTILMQQNSPDDLKLFSQARGALLSELPGYAYDSRGGQGVTVYVIDTGLNPQHEVSVTDYQ
jgi:subtilisin family serine protease